MQGEIVVGERIFSSKEILLQFQNIRKRTAEGDEQHSSLSSIIKAVELSIRKLRYLFVDDCSCVIKVKCLKNARHNT